MIFQMWNGAWNKLSFKVCQVAQASMAYLDKHSTLDPSKSRVEVRFEMSELLNVKNSLDTPILVLFWVSESWRTPSLACFWTVKILFPIPNETTKNKNSYAYVSDLAEILYCQKLEKFSNQSLQPK